MTYLWIGIVAVMLSMMPVRAADQSWSGKISDSMCGATHKKMAEHQTADMSDRDCTAACIKGGGQYVFVSGGKVYKIENQDFASLAEHAGHTVHMTGKMTGDSISVSTIVMPVMKGKTTSP